jgi:hypothetical protein
VKKLLALTLVGGLLVLTTGCPSSTSGPGKSSHSAPATHPSERPPMPPKEDTKPTPPKEDTKPTPPKEDTKPTPPKDDKDKKKGDK